MSERIDSYLAEIDRLLKRQMPEKLRLERIAEMRGHLHLSSRDLIDDGVAAEDAEKDECRRRDKRCRYPHCPYCRRYKDLIPQAAHVIGAKGMSGDRRMTRSTADKLMLLCPPIHGLQEQHAIEIIPLDPDRGTWGPCEFYRATEPGRQMYLVAREVAPFVYESV